MEVLMRRWKCNKNGNVEMQHNIMDIENCTITAFFYFPFLFPNSHFQNSFSLSSLKEGRILS